MSEAVVFKCGCIFRDIFETGSGHFWGAPCEKHNKIEVKDEFGNDIRGGMKVQALHEAGRLPNAVSTSMWAEGKIKLDDEI